MIAGLHRLDIAGLDGRDETIGQGEDAVIVGCGHRDRLQRRALRRPLAQGDAVDGAVVGHEDVFGDDVVGARSGHAREAPGVHDGDVRDRHDEAARRLLVRHARDHDPVGVHHARAPGRAAGDDPAALDGFGLHGRSGGGRQQDEAARTEQLILRLGRQLGGVKVVADVEGGDPGGRDAALRQDVDDFIDRLQIGFGAAPTLGDQHLHDACIDQVANGVVVRTAQDLGLGRAGLERGQQIVRPSDQFGGGSHGGSKDEVEVEGADALATSAPDDQNVADAEGVVDHQFVRQVLAPQADAPAAVRQFQRQAAVHHGVRLTHGQVSGGVQGAEAGVHVGHVPHAGLSRDPAEVEVVLVVEGDAVAPFGSVGHRQIGAVDDAQTVAQIGHELIIAGVQIADAGRDGEDVGQQRRGLGLEARDGGRAHVGDQRLVDQRAGDQLLHALLHILIVAGEDGGVQAQTAVEQVALHADFVGVDRFGVIGTDRQEGPGATVEAPGAEAARILGVGHQGVRPLVADPDLGREIVEAGLERLRVRIEQRLGGEGLLFLAVAAAGRHGQAGQNLIVGLAEHGPGIGLLLGVDGRSGGRRTEHRAELTRGDVVFLGHVIGADHIGQGTVGVGREAQFLAELVVRLVTVDGHERRRRAVEVAQHLGVGLAVACDGGQLDRAEIPIGVQGDAQGLQVREDVVADVAEEGIAVRIGRLAEPRQDHGRQTGVLERRAGALVLGVVDDQGGVEARRRGPQQGAAHRGDVLGAHVAAVVILDVAVVGLGQEREFPGQLVLDQGAFHAGAQFLAAVGAERRLGAGAEVEGGASRLDADHAADCVAAVQGSLRPAQYGHAADVEEVLHRADVARQIDAIQLHADRRFEAGFDVGVAEAADVEGAGEGIGADRGQDHVGHLAVQVQQALDLAVLKRFHAEGADRQGHVLQPLFPALSRDDDVGDGGGLGFGGRGLLRHDGRCADDGQGRAALEPV
uniref:PE-PGRS family protein n=1 Tax=Parastrongyloides trichosuri TaxID=131310 RepID=A0A0N4Z3R0_PARTI